MKRIELMSSLRHLYESAIKARDNGKIQKEQFTTMTEKPFNQRVTDIDGPSIDHNSTALDIVAFLYHQQVAKYAHAGGSEFFDMCILVNVIKYNHLEKITALIEEFSLKHPQLHVADTRIYDKENNRHMKRAASISLLLPSSLYSEFCKLYSPDLYAEHSLNGDTKAFTHAIYLAPFLISDKNTINVPEQYKKACDKYALNDVNTAQIDALNEVCYLSIDMFSNSTVNEKVKEAFSCPGLFGEPMLDKYPFIMMGKNKYDDTNIKGHGLTDIDDTPPDVFSIQKEIVLFDIETN